MNFWKLLLLVLVGWTAVGAGGVAVSLARRERSKAVRHSLWIMAIWALYMGTLMSVSLMRPQKVLAIGQDQCFGEMCFAVTEVQELPGYLIHDDSRLIRVSVRISNHGKKKRQSERLIQAYLVDRQGRRWAESTAVSGVRLTVQVAAGDSVISQPVFKVAKDATGMRLVFTHGHWQPRILEIGDSDSLFHKGTVVWLGL
ncbi:MAG TPA: DUF4352 domain-containing protein [Edaphobacter sp.]|nr:DUF4352 domain-containing protein [Edaphobacter sp.]